MATTSPSPAPRRPVVRSLASAVDRPCARPGCPAPARATLTFSYGSREVTLDRLAEQQDPQSYDLCGSHAARTEAPRGWAMADRRPAEDLAPPPIRDDRELGGEATVAVLAAALRAVPSPPTADHAPADAVEDGPPPPPLSATGDILDQEPAPDRVEGRAPRPEPAGAAAEDTVEIAVPRERTDPPSAPPVDAAPPSDRIPRQVPAARDRHR